MYNNNRSDIIAKNGNIVLDKVQEITDEYEQ
jgi:hypothetical protein